MRNFQGVAVVNYTEKTIPFTRIIEHKHFVFGTQEKTVISKEFPQEWEQGIEPYYPVNDDRNNFLYRKYLAKARNETNTFFGGRLAEFKYYNMDEVILSALTLAREF